MNKTMTQRGDGNAAKRAIVALLCLAALVIGGVFAYLTATDTAVNKLSIATKLDIEVVEPNWNPDNAVDLLPTEEVAKDPAIHNLTDKEMWVFADVVIPTKNIVVADEAGHKQPQAVTDLFTYNENAAYWTLQDTIVEDGKVIYRYAYNQVLDGNGTTPSIFDTIKVCNYVDGQIDTASAAQQIIINGYGVQKEGFDTYNDAFKAYFGEPSITISEIIVNDDAITNGENYELVRVEPQNTASTSTATKDDQVTFEDVTVVKNTEYAVVPEGGNPSTDSIVDFVTDKDITDKVNNGEAVEIGTPAVDNRTAFAVFSADDKSLNFYKREVVPTAGTQFEGKTATDVYTGIENLSTNYRDEKPWYNHEDDVLTASVVDEGISPSSTAFWFSYFKKCSSIDVTKLDTSNTTDMSYMFDNCSSITSLDLSNFKTGKATKMQATFQSCKMLPSIDVSGFDTSNVVDMSAMFGSCESITSLDLSNFNTSKVTDMNSMFAWSPNLSSLNISNFDTSKVTDIYFMFAGCPKLNLDCSSWNVSAASNYSGFNMSSPGVTEPKWVS